MDDIFLQIEELTRLKKHYKALSSRYRFGQDKMLQSEDEVLAYIASRMPATYAVCVQVYRRLKEVLPNFQVQSMLDVGSGPGTSLLALLEHFDAPSSSTLVEPLEMFTGYAKKFLKNIHAVWHKELPQTGSFDLVTSSYMLSELDESAFTQMLPQMVKLSSSCIVLIDTGTPHGYTTLMKARDYIINEGWHIVAPCPHQKECPLHAPDWCHFSCRLPRSRVHKAVKGGALGYEDEKFCYLIASKEVVAPYDRVIMPPMKRSGHVHLKLCMHNGEASQTLISKKMGERYQQAKKREWGDIL